jgi:hypothetical protein
MILKQVIHFPETNSVEATWVEVITPAYEDAEGNIIPAIERQIRCHSYSDRQMDLLEADLGNEAAEYQTLIETVRANIQPLPVPTESQLRETAKAERAEAVANITVTTAAGNTFDGDETSQGRMARAIIALQATGTASVNWVLADNAVIEATTAELTEALALSGAAQAALWLI